MANFLPFFKSEAASWRHNFRFKWRGHKYVDLLLDPVFHNFSHKRKSPTFWQTFTWQLLKDCRFKRRLLSSLVLMILYIYLAFYSKQLSENFLLNIIIISFEIINVTSAILVLIISSQYLRFIISQISFVIFPIETVLNCLNND